MGRLYTFNLALFAATGSFLFGYDQGVMTDVIASENFLRYFNTTKTSAIIGAINSTFSGGGGLRLFLDMGFSNSYSLHRCTPRRVDDGSIWPKAHNPTGCFH